jgi:hypothetical protein
LFREALWDSIWRFHSYCSWNSWLDLLKNIRSLEKWVYEKNEKICLLLLDSYILLNSFFKLILVPNKSLNSFTLKIHQVDNVVQFSLTFERISELLLSFIFHQKRSNIQKSDIEYQKMQHQLLFCWIRRVYHCLVFNPYLGCFRIVDQ